jgi:hypothetical protein
MLSPACFARVLSAILALVCLPAGMRAQSAPTRPNAGETIVMIRHGEKPDGGLGQLNCKGLNRALALPSLLIGRYGRPDFIYAPDPAERVDDRGAGPGYSYVRPLATIEPTAIQLGMPVNAQIGFTQIDVLEKALLQPAYAHALIFVAWEHELMRDFAAQLLETYGAGAAKLPDWPNSDYETIYVFHVTWPDNGGKPHLTLEIQKEGLTAALKDTCPASSSFTTTSK